MKSGKFSNVPLDEGTKIVKEKQVEIGSLEALHQTWIWDGVLAESLIFADADLESNDEQYLESIAKNSGLVEDDSQFTFKHGSEGFTFVNFNFFAG